MKITVVGAGNVGATCAMRLLEGDLGDIVLIDIAGGIAQGKAEDLMDAASLLGHTKKIVGGDDYALTKESDIVVITAGFARKPGMTREELLSKNAAVVGEVSSKVIEHSKDPIIIVVTNPLDIMTYLAWKTSKLNKRRVLGMAGCLDSSRMNLIASRVLNKDLYDVDSLVLGTHGETMVPASSHSKIDKVSFDSALSKDNISEITDKTKARGAEIVSYLGSGSAYYAPSAGLYRMVKAIIEDSQEILPCSCLLEGEYGINDLFLGVPAQLGRDGISEIIQLPLSDTENALLKNAADSLRSKLENL